MKFLLEINDLKFSLIDAEKTAGPMESFDFVLLVSNNVIVSSGLIVHLVAFG